MPAKRAQTARADRNQQREAERPRHEEACEALERFVDDVSSGTIVIDADESDSEVVAIDSIRHEIAGIRGSAA